MSVTAAEIYAMSGLSNVIKAILDWSCYRCQEESLFLMQ